MNLNACSVYSSCLYVVTKLSNFIKRKFPCSLQRAEVRKHTARKAGEGHSTSSIHWSSRIMDTEKEMKKKGVEGENQKCRITPCCQVKVKYIPGDQSPQELSTLGARAVAICWSKEKVLPWKSVFRGRCHKDQ